MDVQEVVRRRLAANGLAAERPGDPEQVVRSLLAVQSQDVQPSAWSVAQRLVGGTEALVEQVRAQGGLLRTHVLRTTWHDVAAEDLRWLVRLTGPRVLLATAGVRRGLGLDDDLLATARRAVEAALPGRSLTRAELAAVLAAVGVVLDSRALGHLLMHLELTGVVCSGERRGRWQTLALLDERVPPTPERDHETAVAELVRRFLHGHGPAAVQDLAWWSSLRVSDVRAGLAALGDAVRRHEVGDLELWSPADGPPPAADTGVLLVQLYDEHLVAFTRSKTLSDPERVTSTRTRPFLGVVLQDGVVAGSWGRTVGPAGVTVHVAPIGDLDPAAVAAAAQRYGAFLGLPATVRLKAG